MSQTSASSCLLYGKSGNRKTTNMLGAAEYILETTGRHVRLVNVETAGADLYSPYIDAGVIEPLWLNANSFPRSTLRKIVRGEWPYYVDAKGGLHSAKTEDATKAKWIKAEEQVAKGVEIPGGYIIEGITSLAELIMQVLSSEGRSINKDPVDVYTEEGEKLGGSSRTHYGATHNDIMFLLDELPKQVHDATGGRVMHVFFTGHENKGEDEETRQPIYGPATVGKAITNKIQKKVGTLIHAQDYLEADPKDKAKPPRKVVRLYFDDHPDPDNSAVKWMAKPRIPATQEAVDALYKKWPGGFLEHSLNPPMGLKQFLEFQDSLKGQTVARLADLVAKIRAAKTPSAVQASS